MEPAWALPLFARVRFESVAASDLSLTLVMGGGSGSVSQGFGASATLGGAGMARGNRWRVTGRRGGRGDHNGCTQDPPSEVGSCDGSTSSSRAGT